MSSRPTELHLLRPVPGDTPIHRLWAGTKLITVASISVVLSVQPSWPAIAIIAGLVAISLLVARIPRGAARPASWARRSALGAWRSGPG
jgi:energy-coupling factor transporter transmembrane protein EcfT